MKNITVFIIFALAISTMFLAKAQQEIVNDDFIEQTKMLNNDGSSDQLNSKEGWSEQVLKRWQNLIESRRDNLRVELEN